MRPVALPPNALPRFYRGGAGIAALRGIEPADDHMPEDWVGVDDDRRSAARSAASAA